MIFKLQNWFFHPINVLTILTFEFRFASSYHMRKCICYSSHGELHKKSPINNPIGHPLIQPFNQSMAFQVTWRNAWGIFHWLSYLPFHIPNLNTWNHWIHILANNIFSLLSWRGFWESSILCSPLPCTHDLMNKYTMQFNQVDAIIVVTKVRCACI
jgi:hypothetical protein